MREQDRGEECTPWWAEHLAQRGAGLPQASCSFTLSPDGVCSYKYVSIMTAHPFTGPGAGAQLTIQSKDNDDFLYIVQSWDKAPPVTRKRSLFRELCQGRQNKPPKSPSIRTKSRLWEHCVWMILTEHHCRYQSTVLLCPLLVTGYLPITQGSDSSAGFYSWPGHFLYSHIHGLLFHHGRHDECQLSQVVDTQN
jgi:hypothetical protein